MKLFIGLALLSVAFATPLIQPVALPEAPEPALEAEVSSPEEPISVMLPEPEKPAFEQPEYQVPDIEPALVSQDVMDAVKSFENVPSEVQVVDINPEMPLNADVPSEVQVVDINPEVPAEEQIVEEAPLDSEAVSQVQVVDIIPEAPLEDVPAEETVDAVNFVDNAEELAPLEEAVDPVRVVDVAVDEDAPVDPVRIADLTFDAPMESESILLFEGILDDVVDAVQFVDVVPTDYQPQVFADEIPIVNVMDAWNYDLPRYDNPLLR